MYSNDEEDGTSQNIPPQILQEIIRTLSNIHGNERQNDGKRSSHTRQQVRVRHQEIGIQHGDDSRCPCAHYPSCPYRQSAERLRKQNDELAQRVIEIENTISAMRRQHNNEIVELRATIHEQGVQISNLQSENELFRQDVEKLIQEKIQKFLGETKGK